MWADIINASFAMLAGIAVLNHCRTVIKHKEVAGVSILSTAFFTVWGVWNLYYFPSLGQWWSFYGGLIVVFANTLWVFLLIKYRKGE